jgi:RNA polymerase sigma-70 factor (ECF subfamily)
VHSPGLSTFADDARYRDEGGTSPRQPRDLVDDATSIARVLADSDADADLADAQAAAHDPGAFEPIYRRHRLTILRYARSRTTSDDDALELTAVTFERALRSISGFRPKGGGMTAWLLRIARNAAIDEARRAGRRDIAMAPDSEPADPGRPNEAAELRLLVAGLPDRQREAVELRYAAGLTAREIGSVLSISEGAAQKHLERGLRALREAYRDD